MKKILTSILILILIMFVGVSLIKDTAAKIAVEKGVEMVTGLKLRVGTFNIGIIRTLIGIKSLKLYNPYGFEDKIMLDMPEIYVDYDLGAIFKNKIHLNVVRINLKEFIVEKNKDGELNLDALKPVQDGGKKTEPKSKEKGAMPEIQIDNLELKIGKVIYKDYSKGGKPSVQEFDINLNEKYQNINDPAKLVSLIVVKALMNTSIAKLTNFDLGSLSDSLGGTLTEAQKVLTENVAVLQESGKQVTEVAKETTDVLKESADELKDMFKNPFGAAEEEK